jgi:hypothetical protein
MIHAPAAYVASYARSVARDFSHGAEVRAEEIALHQKYLDAIGRLRAAEADGDEQEARRLLPAVERARARWLKSNKRVARGDYS